MTVSSAIRSAETAVHSDVTAAPARSTGPGAAEETEESLYLIGRPPIKDVIRFARNQAVNPPDEGALVEAWNAAYAVVQSVEKKEGGIADDPPISPVGPECQGMLRELLKDPLVRDGYNTVATDVAMVELDRLVVYQKHIDLTFAAKLEARLGPVPSDHEVFKTCLPYDHPQPPVKWSAASGDKFVFMSPSNDLRFLGAMPLQPAQVRNAPPLGVLTGVIGLGVGFGSNFMNAVYAGKRLILNNGSHRAYALRKLGVTHVPCIIQHASSRHELALVAPPQVRRDPDYYLKRARPPMLKDYFNPRLRLILKTHRCLRQVTVRFDVEEHYVRAI